MVLEGLGSYTWLIMEETFVPFRGIKNDLKARILCYKQDWTGGLHAGIRFVTPFFAIAILGVSFELLIVLLN